MPKAKNLSSAKTKAIPAKAKSSAKGKAAPKAAAKSSAKGKAAPKAAAKSSTKGKAAPKAAASRKASPKAAKKSPQKKVSFHKASPASATSAPVKSTSSRGSKRKATDVPVAAPTPAAPAAPKGRGGKKAKVESPAASPPPVVKSELQRAASSLRKVDQKKIHKVDDNVNLAGASVYEDYDCMLNQTNIGANNNKFYVIQVLEAGGLYYAWNRWGRVGEPGQNAMKGPFPKPENAINDFTAKFKDKTGQSWDSRANFTPKPGKYTLIEVGEFEDSAPAVAQPAGAAKPSAPPKQLGCALDEATQQLMKLIFDEDTFKTAMEDMKIDMKKMPLGQLSKGQIARGFDCLDELEKAIKDKSPRSELERLSSKFFTLIPHSFGRVRPPVIDNEAEVRNKKDMLLVLGDIEIAQSLQKTQLVQPNTKNEVPHPLDVKYGMLHCDLSLVPQNSDDFKMISAYAKATEGYRKITILNIWKVDRHPEGARFAKYDALGNRALLWHGTNVAVIVAILQGGLRIMPHSGGRLGRGIYFASENGKSAGYVGTTRSSIGIMFLNEVVLGNESSRTENDSSLTKAPAGSNSVVGRGNTEPDQSQDKTIVLDGKHSVRVPQGKPKACDQWKESHFSQSEYLIYDEAQCRIRYLVLAKFGF